MGERVTLRVKNWKKYQHYKDRPDIKKVAWVKLHCELVNDFGFAKLSDHMAITLVLLWTIAAKSDGEITSDATELSFSIRRTVTPEDLRALVAADFLIDEDSTLENSRETIEKPRDPLEQRRGEEEERRGEERVLFSVPLNDEQFETLWTPTPRKQGKADCRAIVNRWQKKANASPDETLARFSGGIARYLAARRFPGQEWKHATTLFNEIARGNWDEPVTEAPLSSDRIDGDRFSSSEPTAEKRRAEYDWMRECIDEWQSTNGPIATVAEQREVQKTYGFGWLRWLELEAEFNPIRDGPRLSDSEQPAAQ